MAAVPGTRGVRMGVHLDPTSSTERSRVFASGAGWGRWWAVWEYPWLCSTPDSTSSRGTLTVSPIGTNHGLMHAGGIKMMGGLLGVPAYVNARSNSSRRHIFAVTAQGRSRLAADAAIIAGQFDPANTIFSLWNEPNIESFSQDQTYNGGAESTAAVYAEMVADCVDAIRAAVPGLPISLGDFAGRGDAYSPTPDPYRGHEYALAVVDWLIANRPGSMPDLIGFHPYVFGGNGRVGPGQDYRGQLAPLDENGIPTSDPRTVKGWNGHVQAYLLHQGLVARGCPKRDDLLGSGSGAARLSAKLLITEHGEPSEDAPALPDRPYDEAWQEAHAEVDQQVIAWYQALQAYHPIYVRFSSWDYVAKGSGAWGDHYGDHDSTNAPKAAAAVFTRWAAVEDGTDPVQPPVVPELPRAAAVNERITGPPSVYSLFGVGQITANQPVERVYTRDERRSRTGFARPRGVIFLNGASGFAPGISPGGHAGVVRELAAAVEFCVKARPGMAEGYTFLGVTPGAAAHTWGNDAAQSALATDLAAFQGSGICGGAAAGKVALIGVSMGHLTAFNYAVRHPANVAGVLGLIPVCSLVAHYNGGVETGLASGGWPTEINQAYGLSTSPNAATLDATVKAQRDPITRAAEVAGIPWGLTWNADDFIVPTSSVEAFIVAKGGTDLFTFLQRNPTGDHTHPQITGEQLLEFLDSLAW